MTQVIVLNGEIENLGWDWDYQKYQEPIITNPFPGPMQAPIDWDYKVVYEERIGNPLPEGATFEDVEVGYDSEGRLRFATDLAGLELAAQVQAARLELADLMVDIKLDLADEAEIARATELRLFIKENTPT